MQATFDLAQISELTEDQARDYIESIRWPDGPYCPHCGCCDVTKLQGKATRPGVYKCKGCRKQFTVTVGTIFEDSHIPLRKWLLAFHLMNSSKKGISALQLQRNLGLKSYKSAWHLAHRIRFVMKQEPMASMLSGIVEADETYVGGKPRKGTGHHKRGRGTKKAPVFVLVERGGRAVVRPVGNVTAKTLKGAIRESVNRQARIISDDLSSYHGIGREFAGGHDVINHSAGQYAVGDVHTNTAESFFSLLKRGIMGAFHHVSKKHLHRYCDEFGFRWDHRKVTDGERTRTAIAQAEGKRLMFHEPIAS